MKSLLTIFILLFASIYLGVSLHQEKGYVLIATQHWTVEATLWTMLLAAFILFLMLHTLLIGYRNITELPKAWKHHRQKNRIENATDKTTQGLIAFSEGYWQTAKTYLMKALPDTQTPLINYLIAARAAQELGDCRLRDNYLREAQRSMPSAKIAVELTQAQLQLSAKQWEQALATLRHLHDLAPKHPYVFKCLAHLYEAIEDWTHLLNILPDLKRYRIFPEKKLQDLTRKTYLGCTHALVRKKNWEALHQLIEGLPKFLKYDPEITASYCRALILQNESHRAEIYLRKIVAKQPEPIILQVYGELPTNVAQISVLESLLKNHSNSAALHRCLGELYFRLELWGKAKTHLEQSLQIKATPESFYALGKLLDILQEKNAAYEAYKQGLHLAILSQ